MLKKLKHKISLALQTGQWKTARILSRELDRLEAGGEPALDGQLPLFEDEDQKGPEQGKLF